MYSYYDGAGCRHDTKSSKVVKWKNLTLCLLWHLDRRLTKWFQLIAWLLGNTMTIEHIFTSIENQHNPEAQTITLLITVLAPKQLWCIVMHQSCCTINLKSCAHPLLTGLGDVFFAINKSNFRNVNVLYDTRAALVLCNKGNIFYQRRTWRVSFKIWFHVSRLIFLFSA